MKHASRQLAISDVIQTTFATVINKYGVIVRKDTVDHIHALLKCSKSVKRIMPFDYPNGSEGKSYHICMIHRI